MSNHFCSAVTQVQPSNLVHLRTPAALARHVPSSSRDYQRAQRRNGYGHLTFPLLYPHCYNLARLSKKVTTNAHPSLPRNHARILVFLTLLRAYSLNVFGNSDRREQEDD